MMKTISQEGKKRIAIVLVTAIIFLLIGTLIGVGIGISQTADWMYERGVHFLEIKGYELDVDEDELNYAVNKYKDYLTIKYP